MKHLIPIQSLQHLSLKALQAGREGIKGSGRGKGTNIDQERKRGSY